MLKNNFKFIFINTIIFLVFFIPLNFVAAQSSKSTLNNDMFNKILNEASLIFSPPSGFKEITGKNSELYQHNYVLLNQKADIEIRYMIRPLKRLEILYDDPHSSAPDPNHVFPLIFQALTDQLANARYSPSREYSFEKAKSQFNADWAAASIFDVTNKKLSDKYSNAFLLAIHKNNKGDAYKLYLFNDYEIAKKIINETLTSLTFANDDLPK